MADRSPRLPRWVGRFPVRAPDAGTEARREAPSAVTPPGPARWWAVTPETAVCDTLATLDLATLAAWLDHFGEAARSGAVDRPRRRLVLHHAAARAVTLGRASGLLWHPVLDAVALTAGYEPPPAVRRAVHLLRRWARTQPDDEAVAPIAGLHYGVARRTVLEALPTVSASLARTLGRADEDRYHLACHPGLTAAAADTVAVAAWDRVRSASGYDALGHAHLTLETLLHRGHALPPAVRDGLRQACARAVGRGRWNALRVLAHDPHLTGPALEAVATAQPWTELGGYAVRAALQAVVRHPALTPTLARRLAAVTEPHLRPALHRALAAVPLGWADPEVRAALVRRPTVPVVRALLRHGHGAGRAGLIAWLAARSPSQLLGAIEHGVLVPTDVVDPAPLEALLRDPRGSVRDRAIRAVGRVVVASLPGSHGPVRATLSSACGVAR